MSLIEEEEVCGHPLVRQLVEPVAGVPIKKRPLPSGTPCLKRSPSEPGSSISNCGGESFSSLGKSSTVLNLQKSEHQNVIPKGKGINNFRDLNSVDNEKKRGLLNGLPELPFREKSDKGSFASVDESQCQKFMASDLQLASLQNGKNNQSPLVKEEKVDQFSSGLTLPEPPMAVPPPSYPNPKAYSIRNHGKIPNLDLNVPLDPVDSFDDLPMMNEGNSKFYRRATEDQTVQSCPMAATFSKISGISPNLNCNLNLSNAVGHSNKHGSGDVTLDLQLKPPTRPELGINWKGIAPPPELSLSLFGNHTDAPPSAVVKSHPIEERSKESSGEVPTPASEKSPVEKIVKHEPCDVSLEEMTTPTGSRNQEMASGSGVKKELPEEPSEQHINKVVGKTNISGQENSGLLANCPELENTASLPCVSSKTGFDLNSEISPDDNRLHNGPDMPANTSAIPIEKVEAVIHPKTQSTIPDVEKSLKSDENASSSPSPLIAAASSEGLPSMSTSFEAKMLRPAGEACEAAGQPSVSIPEPADCNPDEASGDCKPIVQPTVSLPDPVECKPRDPGQPSISIPEPSDCNPDDASGDHKPIVRPTVSLPEPVQCKSRDADEAFGESSVSLPQSVVCNPQDPAACDGMSQGSAEMDCSDDDNTTVSQLPTADKLRVDSFGNCQISGDGHRANLCPKLKKEHYSDTQQDSCSSSTAIKILMQGLDGKDEGGKLRDALATNPKEGKVLGGEVCVNANTKEKQLVTSDKTSVMNNCDDDLHDAKIASGPSSTDLRRSSALEASTSSPGMELAKQSHKTSDDRLEKSRSPEMKSKRARSPNVKRLADRSEGDSKRIAINSECGTESEEGARDPHLPLRDSAKDSPLDGAASSHMHSQFRKVKSVSDRSENDNSKPNSFRTLSLQNERESQVDKSHWRDAGCAYVNRNERWDGRFLNSEREKNNEDCQGGRHGPIMVNPRRPDHRYGYGPLEHRNSKNFRGPRMGNETEDELAHLPRFSRRRRSPAMNNQMPGCVVREANPDRFLGREIPDHILLAHEQMEGLPDDMMEERFFIPHPRLQYEQADHVLMRRERSLSPVQRRGAPAHFHRGRSPEVLNGHPELMRRSPPLIRMDRPRSPHRRPFHRDMIARRHGSPPFDRLPNDGRGMQRNMRRFGMVGSQEALEEEAFGPPLHAPQLPELPVEAELMERRKFEERRAFLRSLAQCPFGDEEEMLTYPVEGEPPRPVRFDPEPDMVFPDGGGPRELDGRLRNRFRNRLRVAGEQEDGYRYRGPQGWRDGNSNGPRIKRRRY